MLTPPGAHIKRLLELHKSPRYSGCERAVVEAGRPLQASAPRCAQYDFCHILWVFKDHKGAGEMLRVLAALPEDPGSMPSSHVMVYIAPVLGDLASAGAASIKCTDTDA